MKRDGILVSLFVDIDPIPRARYIGKGLKREREGEKNHFHRDLSPNKRGG